VDREALDKLVDDRASPQYRVRRAARNGLEEVVEIPGAAEVLKARLTTAKDPQIRATLRGLLTGFDRPVAMVWYRGGLKELPQAAPGPWLFIEADGRFVYDAKSPLLGGKAGLDGDYRQGTLAALKLMGLKQAIAASGLAIGPSGNRPAHYISGMAQVTLYFRAGQSMRSFVVMSDVKQMRPARKAPAGLPAELKLVATLRDAVRAAPSAPYQGPMALHVAYNPPALRGKPRAQIQKLPEFPLAGVNLLDSAARTGGIRLDDKQLKRARAALAKTKLYRYHKYAGCQVVIAPYIDDAVRLYYGR
jgi:hypothetical protein